MRSKVLWVIFAALSIILIWIVSGHAQGYIPRDYFDLRNGEWRNNYPIPRSRRTIGAYEGWRGMNYPWLYRYRIYRQPRYYIQY